MVKISVIMISYNSEAFIGKAIESVLNQTFRSFELLLIDDGSTDDTLSIMRCYAEKDQRISVFTHQNRGVGYSRNFGVKEARGEYISFVDSDDWIAPSFLEVMLAEMEKTDADLAICDVGKFTDKPGQSERFTHSIKGQLDAQGYTVHLINGNIPGWICNKIYKKKVFDSVLFDEELRYWEDLYFNVRISSELKNIIFVSQALYFYRQNRNGITKTIRYLDIQNRYQFVLFLEKLFLKNKNREFSSGLTFRIYEHIYALLLRDIFFQDNREACVNANQKVQNIKNQTFLINYSSYKLWLLMLKTVKYILIRRRPVYAKEYMEISSFLQKNKGLFSCKNVSRKLIITSYLAKFYYRLC